MSWARPENRFSSLHNFYALTTIFEEDFVSDPNYLIPVQPIPREVIQRLRDIHEQIQRLRESHSIRHQIAFRDVESSQSYRDSIFGAQRYLLWIPSSPLSLLNNTEGLRLIARLPAFPCTLCSTYVDDRFGPRRTLANLCVVCEFTSQVLLRLERLEFNHIGAFLWIREQERSSIFHCELGNS